MTKYVLIVIIIMCALVNRLTGNARTSIITACRGQDVFFDWSYTISPNTRLDKVEWSMRYTEMAAWLNGSAGIQVQPKFRDRVVPFKNGTFVLKSVEFSDVNFYRLTTHLFLRTTHQRMVRYEENTTLHVMQCGVVTAAELTVRGLVRNHSVIAVTPSSKLVFTCVMKGAHPPLDVSEITWHVEMSPCNIKPLKGISGRLMTSNMTSTITLRYAARQYHHGHKVFCAAKNSWMTTRNDPKFPSNKIQLQVKGISLYLQGTTDNAKINASYRMTCTISPPTYVTDRILFYKMTSKANLIGSIIQNGDRCTKVKRSRFGSRYKVLCGPGTSSKYPVNKTYFIDIQTVEKRDLTGWWCKLESGRIASNVFKIRLHSVKIISKTSTGISLNETPLSVLWIITIFMTLF